MPLPAMNISEPSARKPLPKSKPKRKSTRLACAKTTNGSVAARNHVPPKHFPEHNSRSKRTRKLRLRLSGNHLIRSEHSLRALRGEPRVLLTLQSARSPRPGSLDYKVVAVICG